MVIKTVKLVNFRSHDIYKLECKDMTSLILGENGSGKTSVLEAIYIAMRGKSFKAVDKEILKYGTGYYQIEIVYQNGEKIIINYDGNRKQFLIKEKKFGRLPRKDRYPVVLFEPNDLNLINSSPTKKRDYFDRIFTDLNEKYNNSLSRYNKTLKQRNEALKNDFLRREDLFSWNIMLARYGFLIKEERKKNINKINELINDYYNSIAENNDKVKINYTYNDIDESEYLRCLENDFEKDKITGYTNFGIHKDNYIFNFNQVDASGVASRGEIRSIILALKFIEARLLFEENKQKPLILLDDVFSELDNKRQKCLVQNFKDHQVILTSVNGVEF